MFKILCINLAERTDRRAQIEEEINKFGCYDSFEIVEAVRDTTCFLSHRKCIELAKERGWKDVLILEDDCVFTDDAFEVIQEMFVDIAINKIDWSILFFGPNLQGQILKVSDNLLRLSSAFALHAYLVNENVYDAILALPYGREMDVQISSEIIPNFPCFMPRKIVAQQRPSFSDLQGRFRDYTAELDYNFQKWGF